MDYTKSSVSRIMFVAIGILLGILLVGTLLTFLDTQKPKGQSVNRVFPTTTPAPTVSGNQTPISGANPASVYCAKNGGKTVIQTRGDGGQYGLCDFGSGMACEEWAMMRGDCPIGGIRTTGFDNVEQKYCVWSGGSTLAQPNATCTFNNSKTCSVDNFYNGTCTPN